MPWFGGPGRPGGRAPADQVVRRVREGDLESLAAVQATARWIGVGMIDLVNSLTPEMLILGGMFEELLDVPRPTISEQLQHGIYDAEHQRVELVKPRFGRDAVLIGAAEMALQVILNDPASVRVSDQEPPDGLVPLPLQMESFGLSMPESLPALDRR
ncbi:MAG: ROK family protein [Candidatus Dormibacteria bacterium]